MKIENLKNRNLIIGIIVIIILGFFALKYLNIAYYSIKLERAISSYCEVESEFAKLDRKNYTVGYAKYSIKQCKNALYNDVNDQIYSECQEKFNILGKSAIKKCAETAISNFSKNIFIQEIPNVKRVIGYCKEKTDNYDGLTGYCNPTLRRVYGYYGGRGSYYSGDKEKERESSIFEDYYF